MAMLPSLISVVALAVASTTVPLAGVSDEETTISSAPDGSIADYHYGKGDVIFVRDRTLRWYRVQLNKGCLSNTAQRGQPIAFESGFSQQIDRFTRVHLLRDHVFCNIDSIRRSAAPPQVDSKSVVTLD